MMRLHVNSFMRNVCTVASHYNILWQIAVYDKPFSQERVVGLHHLPHVTYCGYYGHVHA